MSSAAMAVRSGWWSVIVVALGRYSRIRGVGVLVGAPFPR